MAAEWIQIRVMIASDPQVLAMAKYLTGQRRFQAWMKRNGVGGSGDVTRHVTACVTVATLVRVWGVANDRGEGSGDDLVMRHADLETIDAIAGVPCFGAAMRHVQWAVEEADNGVKLLRFPRFVRYNTPAADRVKQGNAERQRRYRERQKSNVTRDVTDASQSNDRVDKSRGEERREESKAHPGPIRLPVVTHNPTSFLPAPDCASPPGAGPGRTRLGGDIPIERFIQVFLLRHGEALGFAGPTLERQRRAMTAIAVRMFQHPDRDQRMADSVDLAFYKRSSGMQSPVKAWQAEMSRQYPKQARAVG